MNSKSKLINSGDVILEKKDYGTPAALIIATLITVILNHETSSMVIPDLWYIRLPLFLITLLLILYIIDVYILTKIHPAKKFGNRYDDIIYFDDYLIGRAKTRFGTTEDIIEFNSILFVIKGIPKNEIAITFHENFISNSNNFIHHSNQVSQDYKFSRSLSIEQKNELVKYLNDRIKANAN